MLRNLFLIVFFTLSLFSSEENKTVEFTTDKIQLIAKNLNNGSYKITAKGDVLLTTPKYYIMADELIYFKESKQAEVFGNVVVVQNGTSQLISEYAYFDFKNDEKLINPILLFSNKDKLWINSEKIDTTPNEYSFGTSTISSCDCMDPTWSMRVSSANHDNVNQWMHLYNMRLYVGDIPVFYIPYFGYPTDNTRRTGLLAPTMGYSLNEGFLYAQPIYLAPDDNWDLEVTPQNRIKRGQGVYTTYRYADSSSSIFIFKTGIFKEKNEYKKKYSLESDTHYGFNLDYDRSNIFQDKNSKDELSIWFDGMNDIEYRNLDNENLSATGANTSYGTNRESYINYYYDMARWYNGVYFKYYLDTSSTDDSNNMQQLPQYQSHLYTDSLVLDKLVYSIDILYTNYNRDNNVTAQKTDLSIPVSYEFELFNDYLYLKLKEDTTISNIQYGLDENQYYKDGNYIRSNHEVSLSTDLIKPYKDIAHSINLGLSYTVPKIYEQSGDIYSLTSTDDSLSDFSFTKDKRNLSLNMKQYFYSLESKELLLSHSLSQAYEHKNSEYVATNLENTLTINYSLGSISNRMIYNQEDKEYILSSSSFSFDNSILDLDATHYKTKSSENTSYGIAESMTFKASVEFAKRYTVFYSNSYDILNKESSEEVYSLKYDESCWSLQFELKDSLVTSSSLTSSAIRQDIYYLRFELKPLGGYVYKHELDEREK